jgi:hypothetical protein
VDARRVAAGARAGALEVGQHALEHLGVERRGGVVVEVDLAVGLGGRGGLYGCGRGLELGVGAGGGGGDGYAVGVWPTLKAPGIPTALLRSKLTFRGAWNELGAGM